MGDFVINTRANSLYYFQFKKDRGEVLLSSEGYSSKSGCLNGIETTRVNAKDESKFIRMESSAGGYYFNLKATNGQLLAISEKFNSLSKMNEAINFIRQNASDSSIVDRSSLVMHR